MQRTAFYFVILIIAFFYSCGRRPRYVLPEDKMTDVLYDIQLAQAIYRSDLDFNTDEKKDALIGGVLQKYNLSQADLDSSLLWYSDNVEYYMAINDSVASRLRANNKLVMDAKLALTEGRDFANVLLPTFFYLTNATPTLSFNIDSARLQTIDYSNFNLKFNVQGLDSLLDAKAAVYFTYKDTLIKDIIALDKNTEYIFSKPQIADSLLKSITGYVHVANKVKGFPANVVLYDITYLDTLSQTNNESKNRGLDDLTVPDSNSRVNLNDKNVSSPPQDTDIPSDGNVPKRKQLRQSK